MRDAGKIDEADLFFWGNLWRNRKNQTDLSIFLVAREGYALTAKSATACRVSIMSDITHALSVNTHSGLLRLKKRLVVILGLAAICTVPIIRVC